MTTKLKAKPFALPEERVNLRYILRQKGNITNRKHVAYGGKLEDVKDDYFAKRYEDGTFAKVFTDEEQAFLENELSLPPGSLNPNKVDGFYRKFNVKLGKEGMSLDLSKPHDFIKYKVLGVFCLN